MDMISKIQQSVSPMNSSRINNSISNSYTKIPTPSFATTPTIPYLSPRYDSNPTTILQADTSNFKQVVQMLTGLSKTTTTKSEQPPPQPPQQQDHLLAPPPPLRNFNIPPKKQGFKLYERRNKSIKNSLMINPLMPSYTNNYNYGFSPRKLEIVSPSLLHFPSLALSPVTPLLLNDDPFEKFKPSLGNYDPNPSSRTITQRDSKPKLLPLFPVTSPRFSESSSS